MKFPGQDFQNADTGESKGPGGHPIKRPTKVLVLQRKSEF